VILVYLKALSWQSHKILKKTKKVTYGTVGNPKFQIGTYRRQL